MRLYMIQFDGEQEYVEATTMGGAIKIWLAASIITRGMDGDEEPESCARISERPVLR